MQQNFIFGGNTGRSYNDLKTQRELAQRLMLKNATAPRNVGEGLNAIGQALLARSMRKKADEEEGRQRDEFADQWASVLGGFGGSIPASYDSSGATGETVGGFASGGDMNAYADAIASIESAGSGDYSAVGPTHPKMGRALGRYQIMESNIGPWAKEALGREVTADEFMANPQLQDAIFQHKFGGYVEKYGPEGAAQAWFGGPGGVGKLNRKDSLGTSIGDYTQKFSSALGNSGGQPQATQGGQSASMQQVAQLLQLAQSPYASEGQRAVAQMLLGQYQQQQATQAQRSDPMYRMDLRLKEAQLNKAQNPQTYRQATGAELGLTGPQSQMLFNVGPDGRITQIGGGGTNVTVNNQGNAVEPLGTDGQILVQDPNAPGGYRVEVAPGSKMDIEQQEKAQQAQRASESQATNETTRRDVVLETTGRMRDMIKRDTGVLDLPEVGIVGAAVSGINQESADMAGMIDTLKGMVVFDRLEKLKQASANGASGLGQVTEREIALLGAQLGALEQNLSKDLILETLDTVDNVFGNLSPSARDYLTGKSDTFDGAGTNTKPEIPTDFTNKYGDIARENGITVEQLWEAWPHDR